MGGFSGGAVVLLVTLMVCSFGVGFEDIFSNFFGGGTKS